jgi:NADPH:quinone reductase
MRTHARKLLLRERVPNAGALAPIVVNVEMPVPPPGHAVVEVAAAAVNPSDVKAALGLMPHAVWPRTPGRDFAGTVVAGPSEWIGSEVFGTGGDLGVTRDGSHATYLTLPTDALCRKPAHMSVVAAATVGVPFVTAYEGLRRAGLTGAGQNVVVFGANGKVGQAAIQLATRAGAHVTGVERGSSVYLGHASHQVEVLDSSTTDLASRLRIATGGHGADIAYNTVGSPYFTTALDSLAVGGTQIVISTIDRRVDLDVLAFYRSDLRLVGVDSLKLSVTDCARVLNELLPGFEDGSLQPFLVDDGALTPLEQAADAYRRVLDGSSARVVLAP